MHLIQTEKKRAFTQARRFMQSYKEMKGQISHHGSATVSSNRAGFGRGEGGGFWGGGGPGFRAPPPPPPCPRNVPPSVYLFFDVGTVVDTFAIRYMTHMTLLPQNC